MLPDKIDINTYRYKIKEETKPKEILKLCVNTRFLQSRPVREEEVLYVIGVLRSLVNINSTKVNAIINSGSKVNIMSINLMRRLNLLIRPNPHVIIIIQIRDKAKYVGCCKDVPIIISNIINYILILIIAHSEQDLILGRP